MKDRTSQQPRKQQKVILIPLSLNRALSSMQQKRTQKIEGRERRHTKIDPVVVVVGVETNTAPTGPAKGMSDIHKAHDAPLIAAISGVLSWSTDNTVDTTWTSFLKPLGNNGLKGLSITRADRIAFSLGLPSLFIKPPGILPTAYSLSS